MPAGPPEWPPPRRGAGSRTWLVAGAAAVVVLAGAAGTYLAIDTVASRSSTTGPVAAAVAGPDAAPPGTPRPGTTPPGTTAPGTTTPGSTAATTTVPASTTAPSTPSTSTADPTTSFAALYERSSDGVVRIETVSCDGDGVGTGFLLSPTLVATVEHVVSEAAVISLAVGEQRTTGVVIGSDPARDLALVQTERPLTGHLFTLATREPEVGTPVAAIGFPLRQPITMTQGGISGLDRTISVDGRERPGLIQTDTPVNPGNSGGPLLTASGDVVGLVDALLTDANGIAYAVPATQAGPAFTGWRTAPRPQPAAICPGALGPSTGSDPELDRNPAPGPLDALTDYFLGINTGDYATAYAVLGPRLQATLSPAEFADSTRTSYNTDFTLLEVTERDDGVLVGLGFTSLQARGMGPDGETCTRWTLDYLLVRDAAGDWRIERATGRDGAANRPC
ncbi:hypothetical protein GCM10027300_08500 [Modestobacter lapidis]